MNDDILIDLGVASEKTKGCLPGIVEGAFDEREPVPPETCP